ncbi:MAG: hypothetical protein ACT4N5_08600 [Nitrosopumilaceae archaeon]
MKSRSPRIAIITFPFLVTGLLLFLLAISGLTIIDFDFAFSNKNNPYGIQAIVAYSPEESSHIKEKSIQQQDVLWFRYYSQEPIHLLGYYICNGIFCLKKLDDGSFSPTTLELANQPKKWAGSTLGDLPWKIGDIVNIKVKVAPVIIQTDEGEEKIVPDYEKVMVIDLGKLKIKEIK